jgi:hypothetical protein
MNTKFALAALAVLAELITVPVRAAGPLSNVDIVAVQTAGEVRSPSFVSDPSGMFALSGLKPGSYVLELSGREISQTLSAGGAGVSLEVDGKSVPVICSYKLGLCRSKPLSLQGSNKGKISLK